MEILTDNVDVHHIHIHIHIILLCRQVVNPVGGGDGTSTSVGAADGIPTHLPHISPSKHLPVLHIC
ncbi:hypothetical protein N7453_001421 [Penicillium expansum]|nr:hypothetical protein N7453_001421 [Penicillium expansum]